MYRIALAWVLRLKGRPVVIQGIHEGPGLPATVVLPPVQRQIPAQKHLHVGHVGCDGGGDVLLLLDGAMVLHDLPLLVVEVGKQHVKECHVVAERLRGSASMSGLDCLAKPAVVA